MQNGNNNGNGGYNAPIVRYEEHTHLRDYIRIIVSHRWIALIAFLVITGGAVYYVETAVHVYQAGVTLRHETRQSTQLFGELRFSNPQVAIGAEQEFLTSKSVVRQISHHLKSVQAFDAFHLYVSEPHIDVDLIVSTSNLISIPSSQENSTSLFIEPIDVVGLTIIEVIDQIEQQVQGLYPQAKIFISLLKATGLPIIPEGQITNSIRLNSSGSSSSGGIIYLTVQSDTQRKSILLANAAARAYLKQVEARESKTIEDAIFSLQRQLKNAQLKMERDTEDLYKTRKDLNLIPSARSNDTSTDRSSLMGLLSNYHAELQNTNDLIQITEFQIGSLDDEIRRIRGKIKSSDHLLSTSTLTEQVNQIDATLNQLSVKREAMIDGKKDQHPEIVALDAQIESARRRRADLIEKIKNEEDPSINLIAKLENLATQVTSLNLKLQEYSQRKQRLEQKILEFEKQHPDLVSEDLKLMNLQKKVEIDNQRYLTLLNSMDSLNLMKQMQGSNVTILKPAEKSKLIRPRKAMALTLSIGFGFILGIGVALFLEYMDDSIRRTEDVEKYLQLELVGTVPQISHKKNMSSTISSKNESIVNGEDSEEIVKIKHRSRGFQKRLERLTNRVITKLDSKSQVIESYRTLRSNIEFATVDHDVKVFLVTSGSPGEGKTLTAANLAIVAAWSGKKVLLVDCDLRRPRQHTIFGVSRHSGLSEFLTNRIDTPSQITLIDNLDLITSGELPPNPAELIASKKFSESIQHWKENYDLILIDSPPVISVADATILAKKVDRTLLIVKSGSTKRQVAVHARDLLQKVEGNIFGVVLNDVDFSRQYGYYYYYYYYRNYYTSQDEA